MFISNCRLSKLSAVYCVCKATTFIADEPVSPSGCQGIRLLLKTYQEQVVCIMWRSVTAKCFSLALHSTIKIGIYIYFLVSWDVETLSPFCHRLS